MNKYLVAAAGSGKTTHIVRESLKIKNSKVLITTFTNANKEEIIRKLYYFNNGFLPTNIIVKTWFTFLLYDGVKPYQDVIYDLKIAGVQLVNSKSGIWFNDKNNKLVFYPEDKAKEHYFSKDNRIYSDKISKFVIRVNSSIKNCIIKRLEKIYDYIFIDEVQDLAGYDLELLKELFKSNISIILAGDPRQVTYHTHEEAKYKKYSKGNIKDFIINECEKENVEIDTCTLNKSYRNCQSICDFAASIYPLYDKCDSANNEVTEHNGIYYVKKKDAISYIQKYNPMQLRHDKRVKNLLDGYSIMNFGDCKGLTFDRVIIYSTKPFIEWLIDHNSKLEDESRAKLYVAVTRAKYSVAFIVPDNFRINLNSYR